MISKLPLGSIVFHLLLLNVSSSPVVEALLPGAVIRLSQSGLNYGATVAVDTLAKAATHIKIPDVSGSANVVIGKISYSVTNMKVVNFQKPSTVVTLQPGHGLTWSVSNADVSLTGDWRYKMHGLIPVRDHGDFTAEANGIRLDISVTLGVESTQGRPTIRSTGCYADIADMHLHIHGGASWLYNLFKDQIIRPIKKSLQSLICKEARKAVDTNADKELSTMPIQAVILQDWLLDYRLLSAPSFQQGYIESYHKGEFFHKGDPSEAPFTPSTIQTVTPANKMVTIWLSDYALNSALYVLYKQHILAYNLTSKDLPQKDRGYLDITCHTTFVCMGSLIKQLRKYYPNASVEFAMEVSTAPEAVVTNGIIEGTVTGRIIYGARLTNNSLAYLFTTQLNASLQASISLNKTVLVASVTKLDPVIKVIDSAVGNVSDSALNTIFTMAAKSFIVPKLNEAGSKGFAIPMIKHVSLLGTSLHLESRSLRLETDLKYTV